MGTNNVESEFLCIWNTSPPTHRLLTHTCQSCYDLFVGKTRARDAALNAIQSPLLDIGIERATGIVWNITGGNDLTLTEVTYIYIYHWWCLSSASAFQEFLFRSKLPMVVFWSVVALLFFPCLSVCVGVCWEVLF